MAGQRHSGAVADLLMADLGSCQESPLLSLPKPSYLSRVQGPTAERAVEGVWVPGLLQILTKVKQEVPSKGSVNGRAATTMCCS